MLVSEELKPLAEELSQRWRELGRTLASRKLMASLHPGLPSKLTPTKLHALDLLEEWDGLRIGELADRVGLDETTATRLVDRLEAVGLAERLSDVGDRRATVVSLTPAGHELVANVNARRQLFFCDVLAVLEPDERTQLVHLTTKASEALRARSEELVGR
jgi:DNA-binding MarR family transcriptional regulator